MTEDLLDLIGNLHSEERIGTATYHELRAAILRLHVASPSVHPPRAGGKKDDEVETIFVCGKCGTHYVDRY